MGHKGMSWFRHPVRQWDIEGVSACDGETVKTHHHFILALPEPRHGSFARQISVDPIALDFRHCDVADRSQNALRVRSSVQKRMPSDCLWVTYWPTTSLASYQASEVEVGDRAQSD